MEVFEMKKSVALLAIFALVLSPVTPAARAATYTVTTNADSGAGSLRQAITDANAATGSHTIAFSGAIGTINLLSALPSITFTPVFDLSGATGTVSLAGGAMGSSTVVSLDGGAAGGTFTLGTGAGMPGTNELVVGDTGRATLNVTNGATLDNTVTRIGNVSGSTGAVTVDGAGSAWTTSDQINVGYSGTGTLDIINGGSVTNSWYAMDIGENAGSVGIATVSGAGSSFLSTHGARIWHRHAECHRWRFGNPGRRHARGPIWQRYRHDEYNQWRASC